MRLLGSRIVVCVWALLGVALPGSRLAAARISTMLQDQGLDLRGLRYVATASWRPGAVAVATDRQLHWRVRGRRWHRLASLASAHGDPEATSSARIHAVLSSPITQKRMVRCRCQKSLPPPNRYRR